MDGQARLVSLPPPCPAAHGDIVALECLSIGYDVNGVGGAIGFTKSGTFVCACRCFMPFGEPAAVAAVLISEDGTVGVQPVRWGSAKD